MLDRAADRKVCATAVLLAAFLVGPLLLRNAAAFASEAHEPMIPVAESPTPQAQHSGDDVDLSAILLGHVLDSDEWELVPGMHGVHLPHGVSVHLLMVWLAAFLVGGAFLYAARKRDIKSRGLTNALEVLIVFVRDDVVYPVMGEKRGEKWLPFFTTLFVFLLVVNYLGMIPAFRTATGNFNVTSALALLVLAVILGAGVLRLGVLHFIENMYPSGAPAPIGVFVCFLELTGLVVKAVVLSLRLFANMVAGHLAILSLLAMIFVLSPWFCSVSVPLAVFVYALELLVAMIQALVFTLLSCIFISMASTPHEA